MKLWKKYSLGTMFAVLSVSNLLAQIPAVPAVPAGAAGLAAAGPAAAAGAGNIWSKICMTPEQKAACRERFCKHPLGKLVSNSMKPLGMATGGILFNECCPPDAVKPSDLAKPEGSSEGAAARIKKDEAEAKARREAVRYLGTVDCRYWPEAEEALVNALREDKNECVRWEAAMALQRGCCCTELTVKYLANCVSGEKDDKGPAERSERVIFAAIIALESCVVEAKPVEPPPPPVKEPEPLKEGAPAKEGNADPKKDSPAADKSAKAIRTRALTVKTLEHARTVLAKARSTRGTTLAASTSHATMAARPSSEGIFGMVSYAVADPKTKVIQSASPPVLANTAPTPAPAPSPTVVPVRNIVRPEPVAPESRLQQAPITVPMEKRGLINRLWPTTSSTAPASPSRPLAAAPRRSGPVIGFVSVEQGGRVTPLDDIEP